MKIRFDFVTNSSSSSFVIACKEELNQKLLYELFQISKNHPLYDLLKDVADTILRKASKTTIEAIKEEGYYYKELQQVVRTITAMNCGAARQGSGFPQLS